MGQARTLRVLGMSLALTCTNAAVTAEAPPSAGALMDAMGSILTYYYSAKTTTGFCASRFLDMQADFEATLARWSGRNAPTADAARKLVLTKNLAASEAALDETLKAQLRHYLAEVSAMNESDQKELCFDTMIMMDDKANDIAQRYPREYQFLKLM